MNHVDFDEYQAIIRQKIAYQTLILTMVFIFINGIVKETYLWAAPMIEALVLICIPTLYFQTKCILKNVYFSLKEKNRKRSILISGILGILQFFAITQSVRKQGFKVLIENGQLQDSSSSLFLAILFLYTTALLLIKGYKDARNRELEEIEEESFKRKV